MAVSNVDIVQHWTALRAQCSESEPALPDGMCHRSEYAASIPLFGVAQDAKSLTDFTNINKAAHATAPGAVAWVVVGDLEPTLPMDTGTDVRARVQWCLYVVAPSGIEP
jgi:hypothetical protein